MSIFSFFKDDEEDKKPNIVEPKYTSTGAKLGAKVGEFAASAVKNIAQPKQPSFVDKAKNATTLKANVGGVSASHNPVTGSSSLTIPLPKKAEVQPMTDEERKTGSGQALFAEMAQAANPNVPKEIIEKNVMKNLYLDEAKRKGVVLDSVEKLTDEFDLYIDNKKKKGFKQETAEFFTGFFGGIDPKTEVDLDQRVQMFQKFKEKLPEYQNVFNHIERAEEMAGLNYAEYKSLDPHNQDIAETTNNLLAKTALNYKDHKAFMNEDDMWSRLGGGVGERMGLRQQLQTNIPLMGMQDRFDNPIKLLGRASGSANVIPFVAGIDNALLQKKINDVTNKPKEDLSPQEERFIEAVGMYNASIQMNGDNWARAVGQSLVDIPRYAYEYRATMAAATPILGRISSTMRGTKLFGKLGGHAVVTEPSKLYKFYRSWIAPEKAIPVTAIQNTLNVPQFLENFAEKTANQVTTEIKPNKEIEVFVEKWEGNPYVSALEAWSEGFVENYTEKLGVTFEKNVMDKLGKKIFSTRLAQYFDAGLKGGKWKSASEFLRKLEPMKQFSKDFKQTFDIQGVSGEMYEEVIASPLQKINEIIFEDDKTWAEDFNIGEDFWSMKELAVIAGSVLFSQAGFGVVGGTQFKIQQGKLQKTLEPIKKGTIEPTGNELMDGIVEKARMKMGELPSLVTDAIDRASESVTTKAERAEVIRMSEDVVKSRALGEGEQFTGKAGVNEISSDVYMGDITTKDMKLKEFRSLEEAESYMEKAGVDNLSAAVTGDKMGYEGYVMMNPDRTGEDTYVITNQETLQKKLHEAQMPHTKEEIKKVDQFAKDLGFQGVADLEAGIISAINDGKAFASLKKVAVDQGLITLAEGQVEETTVPHEMVHAYMEFMMLEGERKALYQQVKTDYADMFEYTKGKYKGFTEDQISEEVIAELIANQVAGTQAKGKVGEMLHRILENIKKLLGFLKAPDAIDRVETLRDTIMQHRTPSERRKRELIKQQEAERAKGKQKAQDFRRYQIAQTYSLESPSVKAFNRYKDLLDFKNTDDMKLIRDRMSGTLLGVMNRAGDMKMFGDEVYQLKSLVPMKNELTLKFFDQIQFKKDKVGWQEVHDLIRGAQLKQAEKDILNTVLETEFKDQKRFSPNVFKRAVENELLPLNIYKSDSYADYGMDNVSLESAENNTHIYNSPVGHGITGHFTSDYHYISPSDLEVKNVPTTDKYVIVLKGEILTEENISEKVINIYNSEVAALKALDNIKYGGSSGIESNILPNLGLFAHARVATDGNVRYVSEIQSDVFQKIRVDENALIPTDNAIQEGEEQIASVKRDIEFVEAQGTQGRLQYGYPSPQALREKLEILQSSVEEMRKGSTEENKKYVNRFIQYRNTWYERVIKEEIRRAKIDKIEKLRFPTPHTISKIEGYLRNRFDITDLDDLLVTDERVVISREGNLIRTARRETEEWSDGMSVDRFKAGLEERMYDDQIYDYENNKENFLEDRGWDENLTTDKVEDMLIEDSHDYAENNWESSLSDYYDDYVIYNGIIYIFDYDTIEEQNIDAATDNDSPQVFDYEHVLEGAPREVARFYDKGIRKYLEKLRPDLQLVEDDYGNTWYETAITEDDAKAVEVFQTKEFATDVDSPFKDPTGRLLRDVSENIARNHNKYGEYNYSIVDGKELDIPDIDPSRVIAESVEVFESGDIDPITLQRYIARNRRYLERPRAYLNTWVEDLYGETWVSVVELPDVMYQMQGLTPDEIAQEDLEIAMEREAVKELKFNSDELENGYKNFKKFIATREWLWDLDVDEIRKKMKLDPAKLFFDGATEQLTESDILEMFRDRLQEEQEVSDLKDSGYYKRLADEMLLRDGGMTFNALAMAQKGIQRTLRAIEKKKERNKEEIESMQNTVEKLRIDKNEWALRLKRYKTDEKIDKKLSDQYRKELYEQLNILPKKERAKYHRAIETGSRKMTDDFITKKYFAIAEAVNYEYLMIQKADLIHRIKDNIKTYERAAKTGVGVDLKYQKLIREIKDTLDFSSPTEKSMDGLLGLYMALEDKDLKGDGYKNNLRKKVDRLYKKNVRDMSLADLKELNETIDHYLAQGRLMYTLKQAKDEREVEAERAKLIESTRNMDRNVVRMTALRFDLWTLHRFRVASMLDGTHGTSKYRAGKEGENSKIVKRFRKLSLEANYIYGKSAEAFLRELTEIKDEWSQEELVDLTLWILWKQRRYSPVLSKMIAEGVEGARDGISLDEMRKLMPQKTEYTDAVIDVIRKYGTMFGEGFMTTWEELNNEQIERDPEYIVMTKYEYDVTPKGYDEVNEMADYFKSLASTRKEAAHGSSFARVEGVKRVARHDVFNIVLESMYDQIWYTYMQPELKRVSNIVLHPDYFAKIGSMEKGKAGDKFKKWWNRYLTDIATKGRPPFMEDWEATMKAARVQVSKAYLSFKLSSMLIQPFSFAEALVSVEAKYRPELAYHFAKAYTTKLKSGEYAKDSRGVEDRHGGEVETRASGEAIRDMQDPRFGKKRKAFRKVRRWTEEFGLKPLVYLDIKAYKGAGELYYSILRRDGWSEDAARLEADYLAMISQGDVDVTIRPAAMNQGEAIRAIFALQTFFLNRWGIMHDKFYDVFGKGATVTQRSGALADLIIMSVVGGGLAEVWRAILIGITKGKIPDEEELMERFKEATYTDIITQFPIVGNFMRSKIMYDRSPDILVWGEAAKLFEAPAKLYQKYYEGKTVSESTLDKAWTETISAVGTLAGIGGTRQIRDIVVGAIERKKEREKQSEKALKLLR